MHTHTCEICPTVFKTPYKSKKTCCPLCAYIQTKLQTKAGRELERLEAITYYGAMYDDPLRLFRQSKYYTIIRRIMEFCERHGTQEFIASEFMIENPGILDQNAQMLAAIERSTKTVCKTGKKVKGQNGNCKVIVWRLTVV